MIDQGSVKGPGMAAITQTTPTLAISPEKICFLIVKAREFDVKDVLTDPDTGSNPTDDSMLSVLEDHADDPVLSELRSAINDLNEDEQIDLVALTWLGRGDDSIENWPTIHAEARRAHNRRTGAYLLGMPQLSDYLEEGLAQFGISCEALEKQHL
jgi:hypothetical protein